MLAAAGPGLPLMGSVAHVAGMLVRAATGGPEDARVLRERFTRAELRAALAATQTVGLVISQHIPQVEPRTGPPDDEVVRLVAPTLHRCLTEPL